MSELPTSGAPTRRVQLALLLVITVLAMGRVLLNGWVQDDIPLALLNDRVHSWSGLWTGLTGPWWPPPNTSGLYRPVAHALLTLGWMSGGGAPWVMHAFNLLWYAVSVVAVWALARRLLPEGSAWLLAALYAVHPVHTETVAMAVNQGESLVAAGCAVAAAWWIDGMTGARSRRSTLAAVTATYLLALGLKEHALVLPALLLLLEIPGVVRGADDTSRRWRLQMIALLLVLGAGFWMARTAVLGGLVGADPADGLAGLSAPARYLTMLGAVPEWTRALLWPAHLQADYAPFEIVPWNGWTWAQTGGVLVLLTSVALLIWGRDRRPLVVFGLLWLVVALAPVSNILVTTGVIVAERTLTLPSIGILFVVMGLLPADVWERVRWRGAVAVAAATLLLLGGLRSMQRLGVWHDSERYILALDRDAPDSWHTQVAVGILALQQGDRAEGERRLRTAIGMWPGHARAYKVLAEQYRRDGLCAPAIPLYQQAIVLEPIDQYSRLALVACLLDTGRYLEAATFADQGIAGPGRSLQDAFRAARVTADSAERAHAAPGAVRLAPFAGGYTIIGTRPPRPTPR
jgi:hypothetical protein